MSFSRRCGTSNNHCKWVFKHDLIRKEFHLHSRGVGIQMAMFRMMDVVFDVYRRPVDTF